MPNIRVVHKRPGLAADVVIIQNTLEALQGLLDGGYLEAIRPAPGIHAYVDEEGRLKKLPLNFYFGSEPIVGPAIFSKCNDEGEEIGFENDEALALCQQINGMG